MGNKEFSWIAGRSLLESARSDWLSQSSPAQWHALTTILQIDVMTEDANAAIQWETGETIGGMMTGDRMIGDRIEMIVILIDQKCAARGRFRKCAR